MPQYLIADAEDPEELWTDEGCFIREILSDARVPEVSLAEARVEAGITTQWHRVGVSEWYVIRRGEGLMEVGDESFPVQAGDSVAIPAGVGQRITNTGSEDLCFECICTPRFRPELYENIDPES